MPGGEGGEASRGAPLSRLMAIRLVEAQLAVPSGEALPAFLPSHVTRFSPPIAHKFRRGTKKNDPFILWISWTTKFFSTPALKVARSLTSVERARY